MSNVVDRLRGVKSSLAIKVPCRVATTANITLSGEQTIDGVAVVGASGSTAADRVLVKNQTTASENGIYEVSTGTWRRAPDWDGIGDVVTGTRVYVTAGTANSGEWVVTTTGEITIGTTSVAFALELADDIDGLEVKTSPSTTADYAPIYDAASGTVKKYLPFSRDAGLTQFDEALWTGARAHRIGVDLTATGASYPGDNEWAQAILVNTPTATNSTAHTYKIGLISVAATSDPSEADASILRMSVGIDMRGYIRPGNMQGAAFGGFSGLYVFDGADGFGFAHEAEVNNFGTAQPLVNTMTSKGVFHAVAGGDTAVTTGLKFSSGEFFVNQFYYGIHGFAADFITAFIHLDGAFAVKPTGATGFGTDDPQRMAHSWVADAVTDAISSAMRLTHESSGTVAAAFGLSVEWELDNASGTKRIAGTENVFWADPTNATEDATWALNLIRAGSLAQAASVSSLGVLTLAGDLLATSSVNALASGAAASLFTSRTDTHGDAATVGQLGMYGRDSAGTATLYGLLRTDAITATDTAEVGGMVMSLMQSGSLTEKYLFRTTALYPASNDGAALGTSSNGFADLFLASGGEIRVNNAQVLDTVGGLSTQSDTAANIASVSAAVNTANKRKGKIVFDETNNRLVVALGSAADAAWAVADGSVGINPV